MDFPDAALYVFLLQVNVETDMRIQLPSVKLVIEENCKNVKQCHSSH